MMGLMLAMFGCGNDGVPWTVESSYDPSADAQVAPGNPGTAAGNALGPVAGPSWTPPADAPYAGSLGPSGPLPVPVEVGPATTTSQGSSGPPMLPPGAERQAPLPYDVTGPNTDDWRKSLGPSP